MPNAAPYKILKRDGKFAVVNNAGETKATFDDREKALEYQRALYVNVKGAPKKADRVKWTGKAKPPKVDRAHDAEQAAKKKHKFKKSTAEVMIHTYGGGSYGPCAVCGLPESAEPHAGPDGDNDADDQVTATACMDWAAETCSCGRPFATKEGYQAHFVALHDAEPNPQENEKNDALLQDAAAEVKKGDRAKGGMSDGTYPIMNQAQANSAWKLRNNSKNHSEASVVAHIRSRVKALGLKMPGGEDSACCERQFLAGSGSVLINHAQTVHGMYVISEEPQLTP